MSEQNTNECAPNIRYDTPGQCFSGSVSLALLGYHWAWTQYLNEGQRVYEYWMVLLYCDWVSVCLRANV